MYAGVWEEKRSLEGGNMRSATRRKQDIWFVNRTKDDSHMNPSYTYGKPEKHRFSVSSTSGMPLEMSFGILPNYNRYIVSYDRKFQPEEGTFLFVDKTPELDENGYLVTDESGELTVRPDYILTDIADTQKGILARYGIKKVGGDES